MLLCLDWWAAVVCLQTAGLVTTAPHSRASGDTAAAAPLFGADGDLRAAAAAFAGGAAV